MKAIKQNKVYQIDESQKAGYLQDGFDVYEGEDLIERSPKAIVTYAEYKVLLDEIEELKSVSGSDTELEKEVIILLKTHAAQNDIKVGNATSVAGIVKKIKEHKLEGGE